MENRFWTKVDKSGGPDACWNWMACKNDGGYGQFWNGEKQVSTHRFAYELVNGKIPDGQQGCHRCDNRACCNPAHIFLGTQADNMADKTKKARQARGSRNGNSKLTEAMVMEIRLMHAAGKATQTDIARRFQVSQAAVSDIVLNKVWKTALQQAAEND